MLVGDVLVEWVMGGSVGDSRSGRSGSGGVVVAVAGGWVGRPYEKMEMAVAGSWWVGGSELGMGEDDGRGVRHSLIEGGW